VVSAAFCVNMGQPFTPFRSITSLAWRELELEVQNRGMTRAGKGEANRASVCLRGAPLAIGVLI
jgi:hypothetical protein